MKALIVLLLVFLSVEVAYSTDCINNDTFVHANNPLATCRWIRWKEGRRQEYCKQQEVQNNCPLSCGVCCEDDLSHEFDCDSLKTDLDYCDGGWFKGRTIRDICPKSCGFCKDYVSPTSIPAFINDPTFTPEESSILLTMFVVLLILLVFMVIAGLLQIRGKRKVKKFLNDSVRNKPKLPQPLENINSFGILPTTCSQHSSSSGSLQAPTTTFDSIATISSADKYIKRIENSSTSSDHIELLRSNSDHNREKPFVNWTMVADSIDRDEGSHTIVNSIAEAKSIIQTFVDDLENKLNTSTEHNVSTIIPEKESQRKSPKIGRSHNSAPVKSLHFVSSEDDNISILSGDFFENNEKSATSLYLNRHSFPN